MTRWTLSSLAVAAMALGCVIVGCGPQVRPANSVEVWHWMTDRHDIFVELAKKYSDETGIDVRFELFAPSDAYSQKIVASAHARVLPDIFGILDKKATVGSFIKAGYVADLTEYFKADGQAWEKAFFPKALASNMFEAGNPDEVKPGIYGVPLDVTNIQMVYNKDLLNKAGITAPPETFDEFLAAGEALNRIGVAGFVSGFGELWMADAFASNYAFNIMGEEKVMETFRGNVPYTDPDWVKVFRIFETLTDKGVFIDGIVTKGNKFAEQDFALGRAAFAFNGSWCVNVYRDMNPDLNYGVMLPPKMVSSRPMSIWGGAGSSFFVNNTSTNKEHAVAFLKWFTAKEQQVYLAEKTHNLPSNREAMQSIPEILADFAEGMDHTTHPTIWPLNEEPQVIEAFDKSIQEIIIGDSTPEQAAEKVQAVKVRQMEKAERRR